MSLLKISLITVLLFFISCKVHEEKLDVYNQKLYHRITNNSDSTQNMYVVYQFTLDTTRKMMKFYWDNGKLQSLAFFKNGKKDGHWMQYFDNGNISFDGHFLNDLKIDTLKIYFLNGGISNLEIYKNGLKTGIWKYYSEKGGLLKTEDYSR